MSYGAELVISIGKIQVQERSPYYLYSIALYSIVELAGSGNTSPSWWYGVCITIESKLKLAQTTRNQGTQPEP